MAFTPETTIQSKLKPKAENLISIPSLSGECQPPLVDHLRQSCPLPKFHVT